MKKENNKSIVIEEVNFEDISILEEGIQPGGTLCGIVCPGSGTYCGWSCH